MSNLDLTPTNELVEELSKRFDYFVCVGRKYTKDNGEFIDLRRYNGNTLVCLGLNELVRHHILNDELSFSRNIKDNKDR